MATKITSFDDLIEGTKGSKGLTIPDIYTNFSPLIRLYGESYDIIKKAVFYSIIGSVICNNRIVCSDIKEDARLNLFIPLKSGYGKREIKEVIKKSIESVELNYCEPTSLHSEQLIGKTIVNKKEESIINKGHLADDFLVFEEATELFTDKSKQETRDYIKIALDPIGSNEVYKKSVDTFKKNAVRYSPNCTIVFFFQPLPIEDSIVTRGLLRRGLILSVEPSKGERYKALNESFNNTDVCANWNQWIDFLLKLKSKRYNWVFSARIKEKFNDYSIKLIKQGEVSGKKASSYTDIMFFTLRNLLIKMSCIQSAINDRDCIKESDIDNAFNDLSEFWGIQLSFVVQKIKGDMDYLDMSNKDKNCLFILMGKKCYSKDNSNLMIKDYIQLISNELACSNDTAKNHYYGLIESGYIDSKQVGSYSSRVWLTEAGKKKVGYSKTLTSLTTLEKKPSLFQRFRWGLKKT